jgi:hypothetical protein
MMAELSVWMVKAKTHYIIQSHLLAMLRRWIANEPPPQLPWHQHRKALEAQQTLGAWNTILGRISSQITQAQAKFYSKEAPQRSSHRWTVDLIKKLQDMSFAMWEHRNKVRTDDPTRHLQRDELEEANVAIQAEWEVGDRGLLSQDRFLFRARTGVDQKSLPLKWEWLALVSAARAAAAHQAKNKTNYDQERNDMRRWLMRHNKTATTRTRDGQQTTEKQQETQKQQKNIKTTTKNYTRTQKRKNAKTNNPTPTKKRRQS